jgi:hypothetical protein
MEKLDIIKIESGDEAYCECCGKLLKSKAVVLELNQNTGIYHSHGEVPEGESQGGFMFGTTCAKRILKNGGRM